MYIYIYIYICIYIYIYYALYIYSYIRTRARATIPLNPLDTLAQGWQICIKCIKLQVSLCKRHTHSRSLVRQKATSSRCLFAGCTYTDKEFSGSS